MLNFYLKENFGIILMLVSKIVSTLVSQYWYHICYQCFYWFPGFTIKLSINVFIGSQDLPSNFLSSQTLVFQHWYHLESLIFVKNGFDGKNKKIKIWYQKPLCLTVHFLILGVVWYSVSFAYIPQRNYQGTKIGG